MNEIKLQSQRRESRAQVTLRGRYMLEDGREFACRTVDISAGGVAVVGATRGRIGERVVAYLDELGRLEGKIVRHSGECFTIELRASDIKREWLDLVIGRLAKRQGARLARRGASHEANAAA